MVTCAVYGCCNRGHCKNAAQSDVTFHTFPKDPLRKRQWVRALLHTSNSQQVSSKTCTPEQSRICSAHFEEKYFDRSGVKVRLRKDAVPTIFPDVEDTVAAYQGTGQNVGTKGLPIEESARELPLGAPPDTGLPGKGILLFNEANTPFKGKLKVAFQEDPKVTISEHKTAENEEDIWSSPKKLPVKKAVLKRSLTPNSPPRKKTATDNNKAITQTPLKKSPVLPRQKTPTSKDPASSTKKHVTSNKTAQVANIKTAPKETATSVQPLIVTEQPEEIIQEYVSSPPDTPQIPQQNISPITPHRYREERSSSVSPIPQLVIQNGCESPARSFTSYYDVPVAGSEIVVTQAMIERSTSVSPQNEMWIKQHPPVYAEEVVNQNGTNVVARDAKKLLEQKYKKKIRKLQVKKRKNLLKITSINNMINKLGNQNLLIDDRIGRIVNKLTYNI